uniref:Rad60/SUMO-like domain-containing protein n=1 Tax=Cercocebus atys TaxID=9531 RepID=A0A2K5MVU6_CERAT
MADEKPKEGVKTENNDHINLKVAGQDGSVVQFKIKRHTPLSKLMKAYCERQELKTYHLGLWKYTLCLHMDETVY